MDDGWLPRETPLPAVGVAARGDAARALAERLRALPDDMLARLSGVAAADEPLIVLLGPESALPWVDGAVYLGVDPDAPALRLPTTRRPSTPVDLWQRGDGTYALLPGDPGAETVAVPLGDARPVDRAALERRFP